ncbi:hypothetical protein CHLRE_06g302551v5 [Chlamydomonas reinhardtii]|uniref:Uncharacterized protein n=1 Tax=Chlamydomonas reinhardtii TaxID=3055 RepID=A0A2K3DR26_CHLRE|nr:uncharacterized protein CHLRE_06g302551v5 [Chlamydomonas reinhardtii]PNW83001.1 hypothetical protein CHLRE_06g302551v5 [Chlamydomonas reinhardtii]
MVRTPIKERARYLGLHYGPAASFDSCYQELITAGNAGLSLAALSCTSAAPGARVPVPTFPDKQRGTDTRFGGGNETEAQLAGQAAAGFGSGNETEAQLAGRAAAVFGGGNETEAQLAGRFGGGNETEAQLAARFGGGNETEAQLAGRLEGAAAGGRARLKQVNPRRWSGQVVHKKCGQVLVIDRAPQMAKQRGVRVRCKHCKTGVTVSTKELVMDLCDSDSE